MRFAVPLISAGPLSVKARQNAGLAGVLPVLWLFLAFPCGLCAQNAGSPLTAVQNYRIGRDLEFSGRIAEAERYYNETVRICRDEVARNIASQDTYTAITWALLRQKKYTEVIRWAEQGLRLFAGEYRILETMGEAYFYLNDYDRSLECMGRYANAVPQGERSSVAYFFIAEIFRLRRQYYHADIAYTTALRLDPGVSLWWYRLATVREALGDYPAAAESFRRALRLNPNYAESSAGLARVQERLN
ncbi:MAG: tetratricopeptide repeat protein [Treponema sp.]|jgi:tetratricopeptide (TPR) repeat protein|nr:tetratricopeptide repeat protein [Treponema sp.]